MTSRVTQSRQKIVKIASEMLAGSLSFIKGARQIAQLSFEAELSNDLDIRLFVGIDSETDALPLDPEIRKLWIPSALEKLQPEIDKAEAWARQVGTPRCERLIERFKEPTSN
ncbi:MAG: hypothetical protein WCA81_10000 [Rhizomicrobium sp.]